MIEYLAKFYPIFLWASAPWIMVLNSPWFESNLLRGKENFVENMRRSVEIARNDPGAGSEILRYFADLLVKNGNTDHLVNRIVVNQSTNEVYNLDIAAMVLACILMVVIFVVCVLVKCLKFCNSKPAPKSKIE